MSKLGKSSTGSNVGTGGMATKLTAAIIATAAGADMVIANGNDFHNDPQDRGRQELRNLICRKQERRILPH